MAGLVELSILFGLILVIAHYVSQRIKLKHDPNRMKIISFTGGIFITYMILHMLPQLYQGEFFMTRMAILSALIGFALFHTLEKYIYQHESGKQLRKDLKKLHIVFFFIYHFLIGLVLINITQVDIINGILLFIPILLFTSLSVVSMKEIHMILTTRKIVRVFLSLSTLFGLLLGILIDMHVFLYNMLFGFVVGSLLYIIIVESLPKEREGNPLYFILGLVFYTIIISFTWFV